MSNIALNGYTLWPRPPSVSADNAVASSNALTATQKIAFILQAPKTGNLAKIVFMTGNVVVGATCDIRIETVDVSTGNPSGTLLGVNSNGAQVIANSDDNVQFTTLLTTPVAVTRGQLIAVVISIGAGGNLNILTTRTTSFQGKFPYSAVNTGAWTKLADPPLAALEYDDGTYGEIPGVYLAGTGGLVASFGSGSNPNERGLKFVLPFGGETAGFWLWSTNGHNLTVKLYDAADTVLASATVLQNTHFGAVEGLYEVLWTTPVSLTGGAVYRLTMLPTNAAADVTLIYSAFANAAQQSALDGGAALNYTTRNGSAPPWTDDALKRPQMGLILDAWDTTSPVPSDAATARTLWRELTNERSLDVVPDSVVDEYLLLGLKRLNEIARYHYSDAVINLIAEVQEYTVPADFVEALHLVWNGIELQRSSLAEWRRSGIRWQQEISEGALGEWAIYRDQLVLRAKPNAAAISTASTATLRYVSTPPSIAVSGFDQLLSQHQFIPVYTAVAIWSASHPDSVTAQQRIQYYEPAFTQEAEKAAEYYTTREVSK